MESDYTGVQGGSQWEYLRMRQEEPVRAALERDASEEIQGRSTGMRR